jgi:nucleotide-binding universal stress UspA family protein
VGKILQDAIREEAFDLLVMGSYSRLNWFEVIFGGMTQSALLESSIPLLNSH